MIAKIPAPFFDNSEENPDDLSGILEIDNSCTETYGEALISIVCKEDGKNVNATICLERNKLIELYYHLGSMIKSHEKVKELNK